MSSTTATSLPVAPASSFGSAVRAVFATRDDVTPTIARIALGVMMLPHGLQKTLGLFGGYGFGNTMKFFTETMHIPAVFAFAAILAESLGALALIVGAASRVAALGIGAVFAVAIATVHGAHGFFMNWSGTQKGEGIEFFILGLALVAIVVIRGGGKASIDGALTR